MQNYPIFMNIQQKPCLVVGAGHVALRKVRLLHKAGAKITVIAPQRCAEMATEFATEIEYCEREFRDADIVGNRLITAATNDPKVNSRISKLAQELNIPVNVVDQPELCSFITPSIVDRSPVLVAISTGGSAPVLARLLRSKLEALIPAGYGRLAESLRSYRNRVKEVFSKEIDRRRFWEKIIDGPIAEQFLSGHHAQAELNLEALLDGNHDAETAGQVWLVGAGPGDPDLLTFRALRLMQQADVVLYDRLVSDEILNLTRRDAERIYVGKKRANHSLAQDGINSLLLQLAQQGKRVVRLKGGDPFIFGRGGEELESLREAGIAFQVVPGITSASGCASYAGIPLTHRDHAQSCLFVTGHLKDGSVDLNWQQLALPNQTVVIYMGLHGLPTICDKLREHGVSAEMPIALIERGTTHKQRVFSATLGTMQELLADQNVVAPTLIIVGEVVSLRKNLSWYEDIQTS